MTKQEYDVLTQHDARLAALERGLADLRAQVAALPGVLSDVVADKVAEAIAACRVESDQRRSMVDALWSEREQRRGVTRFWVAVGKTATVLAAVAGAVYGLAQLLA